MQAAWVAPRYPHPITVIFMTPWLPARCGAPVAPTRRVGYDWMKFRYAFDGVGPRWPWYFEPTAALP